ncbi:MAG: DNA repair protein RecO [Candidatus Omnitrophica bacterium]|nr:DNA repair protein RecO [Candidatus Omnitrophota bacterium]
MAAERTLAYVLGTRDYRDTSLMVTLYTRDFGKIKALIKGGRDARNKFGSSFEPFSLNEVLVYRRRRGDLHLVTQAELVDRWDGLRTDLERLGSAAYVAEVIDQLTDAEPHPQVFALISDVYGFMDAGNSPKRSLRIFEIKLMSALGWMPELFCCVYCREVPGEPVYFSVSSGGLVCASCRHKDAPLVMISKGCALFLEEARKRPFADLRHIKVSRELGEKLEQMMRGFLEHHLTRRPKALSFLEKIGAA